LNGNKLSARHLASMGKIQGTLGISGPINLQKCKSGDHALGTARAQQRLSIWVLNRPVKSKQGNSGIRETSDYSAHTSSPTVGLLERRFANSP